MLSRKVAKEVFSISIPVILEMLLYMVILMLDTAMVGKYGGHISVSTVGICSEIIYSINSIIIDVGISISITSFVSRKIGEGNNKAAEEYAAIGFYLGIIISIVISLLLFKFSNTILSFAGAKAGVLDLGNMFIRIACVGMLFKMFSGILSGIMRGYGNTRTPLYAAGLVLILNLFLDYILIFGRFGFYEYGIRGSAIAYSLAQILGFLFMFFYLILKSRVKIRIVYLFFFPIHRLKEFLSICLPTSLEDAAFNLSRLLCLFMIMYTGTIAFAANEIATAAENISFMQGYGFSVAATTLVGLKVGERNYKEAKKYAYICAIFGALTMIICSFFFLTIPKFIINLFIDETETKVVSYGIECLKAAAVAQPFMGVSLIFAGAMKGSGDTKSPFFISFLTSWFIRLPLMFYFIYIHKLPVVYVWWITNAQWCIDGIFMFLMFERRFRLLSKT